MMATNNLPFIERTNVFGSTSASPAVHSEPDLSCREVKLPTASIRLKLSLIGPSNDDVGQQRLGGIYVCKIAPDSVMAEQLFVGDRLMGFSTCGNEVDLSTASLEKALSCLKFFDNDAVLLVQSDPDGALQQSLVSTGLPTLPLTAIFE